MLLFQLGNTTTNKTTTKIGRRVLALFSQFPDETKTIETTSTLLGHAFVPTWKHNHKQNNNKNRTSRSSSLLAIPGRNQNDRNDEQQQQQQQQ
jgi:hypothetical protein